MKKTVTLILLLAVFAALLSSCGKDVEIDTEVKFSIYESNGSDMISFYMTSETDTFGKWEYELGNSEIFTYFHDSEQTKDYGILADKKTASYRTLILQPVSEGDAVISFKTASGDKQISFTIKVVKDENGILRITAEETKFE